MVQGGPNHKKDGERAGDVREAHQFWALYTSVFVKAGNPGLSGVEEWRVLGI